MADQCYNDAFQEVLAALEPRTPTMTLYLERPTPQKLAYEQEVEVAIWDGLTCAEIGRYTIDPVSALHLLHRASTFALDCELVEEAEFTCELYAVVNAWYHTTREKLEEQPEPRPETTCSLSDALVFVAEEYARTDGPMRLKIGAAHWFVG